jgi:chromosome segregation ATPase
MAGILQSLSRELTEIEQELDEVKLDRKALTQRRREIMTALLAYESNPASLEAELNKPKDEQEPDLK